MKRLWFQSFIITVFVFFMLWGANKVTDIKLFTAFDPIGQAVKEVDITNYVFSKLREDPQVDERIVMVNIGALDRRGIAQQIQAINQFKPRVIALDMLLCCEGGYMDTVTCPALKDPIGNLMLSNAIQEAGNVVLGTRLLQSDSLAMTDNNESDSLEISDAIFSDYSNEGFVTLPTDATYQEDIKFCNSIYPSYNVAGKKELAFSVQIAMQFDSVVTKKFLARNKEEELINFRGNIEVLQLKTNSLKINDTGTTDYGTLFYTVDVNDILDGNVLGELFRDRIVIMGYLGDYLGAPAWEDKFFTPMNSKMAGRANPDMFGPVVHANAVVMILSEDYIEEPADWQMNIVAFIVCLSTVALFIRIDQGLPAWFDALSVLIQLAELLLIMTIIVLAFSAWRIKLNLSLSLGVSALVGPCYDIFKSIQNEVNKRLTKRRERVLTP